MAGTEILDTDATPAVVTARTFVIAPADFARSQLQARRAAGMRATGEHAAELLHATVAAHVAAHGRHSAGPALAMFAGTPTDSEIDAVISGICEVF